MSAINAPNLVDTRDAHAKATKLLETVLRTHPNDLSIVTPLQELVSMLTPTETASVVPPSASLAKAIAAAQKKAK